MLLAIVLDVPTDAGNIQIALDRAATSDHLSLPGQLKDMVELHTADTAPAEATGQHEECRELCFLGRTRAAEHERSHTVRQRPRSMPGALDHGPQRLGRSQRRTLEERIRILISLLGHGERAIGLLEPFRMSRRGTMGMLTGSLDPGVEAVARGELRCEHPELGDVHPPGKL